MTEGTGSIWNSVLFLFMGWLLGLLSPVIVDAIKKRHRNTEIRNAVISELSEARLVLASNVYLLESRFGTYDRTLLEWILPILESYKGPNPGTQMAELIRKHLLMNDAQLAVTSQTLKAKPGGGLRVKKYRVPYIESRLADFGAFDETSQALILDIRTKFDLFNEEVDEARFYFKLTYEPGISEENYHLADESLKATYRNLITMARLIIARIDLIVPLR